MARLSQGLSPLICLLFVVVCFLLSLVNGQLNQCTLIKSCSSCIAAGPSCTWCEDKVYGGSNRQYYPRCDFLESHTSRGCGKVSNPPSSYSVDQGSAIGGETRVFPQNITLNLRPGRPSTIKVRVKTPKDFPVDLYYLMDLSKSMEDDLKKIRSLGTLLATEMKNVTSNFRLGFGAFVDKPLGPYTNTEPGEISKILMDGKDQYTFGFKNYLPLNVDPKKFEEVVAKVKISFNIDEPEGSLDALMQVAVCEKAIGWRDKKKARRIVILTTDATFHYAGDGLLVGIVEPNDGRCHLSSNNYSASTAMDYPSLSYLKQKMLDSEIIPIFATTGKTDLYKRVADFFGVESGAVADTLANNSANVVDLIRDAYLKIAKIVAVSTDVVEGLDFKFTSICGPGKIFENTRSCNDVLVGDEVEFNVSVTATTCSPELQKVEGFRIKTSFDDLFVKLNLQCNCDCEKPDDVVVNSTSCNSNGNLACGRCSCNSGFTGRFCQCTEEMAKNESLCRGKDVTGPVCGGRGECECGECSCLPSKNPNELIYGKDCECSNATCGRSFGQMCGGSSRGRCHCNGCICTKDWTGPTCGEECRNSTDACIENDVECGGKGTCVCGKCQCQAGYVGRLCGECFTGCPDPCEETKECVRCQVFQTSELSGVECTNNCYNNSVGDITTVDSVNAGSSERCVFTDADDCSFIFTYMLNNVTDKLDLIVQKDRVCPSEPDVLAIILGVIAGIVGIGLALLLIWKLLATIQDRREFAKFENEKQNARWDTGENPIFKQATSTFQNPIFGGQ